MSVSHRSEYRAGAASAALAALALLTGCALQGGDDELSSDPPPVGADQGQAITAQTVDGDDGNTGPAPLDSGETTTTTAGGTSTSTVGGTTTPTTDDPVTRTDFCEAIQRNNFDIAFDRGASSDTVSGVVPAGQVDLYRIEVGDAQIMNVTLSAEDAVAGIMAPDGAVLPRDFVERTIAPTEAGVYRICVTPGEGTGRYELTVSVIDDNTPTKLAAGWCGTSVNDRGEVRFASGSVSGQVEDSVVRGERDLYSFDAAAGQDLLAVLTSLEDNAVFDLRSPGGELLITEAFDVRTPLPESGTYQFCIGGTRGNATYELEVTIE